MIATQDEIGHWRIECVQRTEDNRWEAVIQSSNFEVYSVFEDTRGEAEHYARQLMHLADSIGDMTPEAMTVALFRLKAKQPIPDCPSIPNAQQRELNCRLLLEEAKEFIEASGFAVTDVDGELQLVATQNAPDYEGMLDACADVDFVNRGNMLALGAGDIDVMQAVGDANLAKFTGDFRIENGKLKKPTGWKPPVYAAVELFNATDDTE